MKKGKMKNILVLILAGMLTVGSMGMPVFGSGIAEIIDQGSVDWAGVRYDQVVGVREENTAELYFDDVGKHDLIGIVSGTISFDSDYISIVSVEKAEWAITYNEENGSFLVVKSTGDYSGTIAKIKYKVIKACPDSADLIQIGNIKYTSVYYNRYSQNPPLSMVIKTDHCAEHAYVDGDIISPASCTDDGLCKKVCTDCGDVITDVIPATGHTSVIDKAVSPKCTESGLTEGSHCKVCGQILVEQTEVPAPGHRWDEDYTVDQYPTCTEEGSESIHCQVCNAVNDSSVHVIPKTGHEYSDWIVTKDATCTVNGIREKTCSICDDRITEIISPVGHVWDKDYTVDQYPTCTEEGSESIHCQVCDDVNDSSVHVIPKTGHEYSDWIVTEDATCTGNGIREKTCSICDDVITEIISAVGHVWDLYYLVDRDPTCTVEGSESIHCSVCDEIKEGSSRAIPKLEHNYDDWVTVTEPTYDETGLIERICTECGYVEQEIIEKIHRISIEDATIKISNQTYTGKALKPKAVVTFNGNTLSAGTDYTISYSNNINAGTAKATIKGTGTYTGTKTATFKINPAAQDITISSSADSVAVGKTTTVSTTGAQGTVTYKSSDTTIATVTKSTGKVTAKKVGKVTITATAAATDNYKAASKTVTIKILPAATAKIVTSNLATGIKLTWKAVTGATGYKVYRGSTLLTTINSGSTVSYTDTGATTNGTKYTFKVYATASTGTGPVKSVITYRVARPVISSANNTAAGKMTVKWGKNDKATGYYIQYCLDKTFETDPKLVNISNVSTVSKVISGLTKGKTYYLRVRTYKTVDGVKIWSAWSVAKTVKITK